jgi:hypothetical protein
MELATRRVIWFAVTDRPDSAWVSQQARNVCWKLSELGVDARFMVHDHDAKYGAGSDLVFQAEGIEVIRTPIAAPKANSHMERQIGSTRRECLDWILIFNRRHLERVLADWFEHYNAARPHRAIGLQPPIARSDPVVTVGAVSCRERLGGLLREYAREPLPAAASIRRLPAHTMGGVVLRCTAKLQKLLGTRPGDLVTVDHSDQDWYANLLWLDGRKCLLLAHTGTLFSVFVPDIPKADLLPIGSSVVALIHNELEAEGLPLDRFGVLDSSSMTLARTDNRTVLG